jgi:hypothetical protein
LPYSESKLQVIKWPTNKEKEKINSSLDIHYQNYFNFDINTVVERNDLRRSVISNCRDNDFFDRAIDVKQKQLTINTLQYFFYHKYFVS